MPIECAACGVGFEMAAESLAGRATVTCPACSRVIVLASAAGGPAGPDTEAYVEPLPPQEVPTAVGAARAVLSLPQDKRVSITILSGERKGEVIVLAHPSVVIGRAGGGGDIQVSDPDMSRTHAAVDCHGSRIVLRDLGSRNGTFVAADRIQTREVEDRTEFRLGNTHFMLLVTDLA